MKNINAIKSNMIIDEFIKIPTPSTKIDIQSVVVDVVFNNITLIPQMFGLKIMKFLQYECIAKRLVFGINTPSRIHRLSYYDNMIFHDYDKYIERIHELFNIHLSCSYKFNEYLYDMNKKGGNAC